jgi:hypothetical protein
MGDGTCTYIPVSGHCLINGVCYNRGDINPNNPCKVCRDDLNPTTWSNNTGNPCNDSSSCTYDDQCVNGICQGTSFNCNDGLACTTDICNGDGTCSYILAAGTCLIDGVCYDHHQANPNIACRECNAGLNQTGWSLADRDIDGIDDCNDNCLNKSNPDQLDWDEDGRGDKFDAMGSIKGWGKNDYHQRDGMPKDGGFIAIEAGGDSAIALHQNGTISAWGRNYYNERTERPLDAAYKAISLRCYHCLALKNDGSVVGWGKNDHGEAYPPARNDIIAIGTGMYHSIALTEAGNIIGWGYNNYGQTTCPPGSDFVSISAGYYHNVALRSNGSICSWGWDTLGSVTNTPTDSNFIAVSAGYNYSLALKSNGTIVAWGTSSATTNKPPAGNNFIAISAGYNNNVALRSDGTLAAWGSNYYGETSGLPAGSTYMAISAGGSYNLAIMNCSDIIGGDVNFDCYTNYKDLRVMTSEWLKSTGLLKSDLDESSVVDFNDYIILADDWMLCSYPTDANCN